MNSNFNYIELLKLVTDEVYNIKKYVSKDDISDLDISRIRPINKYLSIYGLLTGDDKSIKCTDLIELCSPIPYSASLLEYEKPEVNCYKVHNCDYRINFSPLEFYSNIPYNKVYNIIDFLKGKTKKLNLFKDYIESDYEILESELDSVTCCIIEENIFKTRQLIPVYPFWHDDIENGQKEKHLHIDFRYVKQIGYGNRSYICKIRYTDHSKYILINYSRIDKENKDYKFIGFSKQKLYKSTKNEPTITPSILIEKSVLNMDNLNCNKCPHRNFPIDLFEINEDGTRTCPLHGIKLNKECNKVISNLNKII